MCEITPQESVFLDAMVDGICDHYDEWLNQIYMWPMRNGRIVDGEIRCTQFEHQTVIAFAGNNESYHYRITHDHGRRLRETINAILVWGGIGNRQPAMLDAFFDGIPQINNYNDLNHVLLLGARRIIDPARMEKDDWRIPSWSKILAACDPKTFLIYDSRVALALSFISIELGWPCLWAIPEGRGNVLLNNYFIGHEGMTAGNAIIQNQADHNIQEQAIPHCYCLYLELLNRLARNETIRRNYQQYSIQVSDQLMNSITPANMTRGRVDHFRNMIPTGDDIRAAYENAAIQFVGGDDNLQDDRTTWAIKAHLEKMLFMMKESILQEYQQGA